MANSRIRKKKRKQSVIIYDVESIPYDFTIPETIIFVTPRMAEELDKAFDKRLKEMAYV